MMPDIDPRTDAKKKRAGIGTGILVVAGTADAIVAGSGFGPSLSVREIVMAVVLAVTTAFIVVPSGYRFRGHGPAGVRGGGNGSGLGWRTREADEAAGGPAHRWRGLVVVSRVMPPTASRRWLAEAESVLSEIEAPRRGQAIRSYLRSAPRLAVMMWIREVLRRARLGPRRPG